MKKFLCVLCWLVLWALAILLSLVSFFEFYNPPYGTHIGHWLGMGVIMIAVSWGLEALYKMWSIGAVQRLMLPITLSNESEERKEEMAEAIMDAHKSAFFMYGLFVGVLTRAIEFGILVFGFGMNVPPLVFLIVWGIGICIFWATKKLGENW